MPPPCQHERPRADICPVCRIAVKDARYGRLWFGEAFAEQPGAAPAPFTQQTVRAPCIHLGDPIPGPERERLGIGHCRDWRRCALGHGKDGIVCPCGECGTCDDHKAD